jgi:hypothetical protein
MDEQRISLKSVKELRQRDDGEYRQFVVPAYQRGFRWSKLQVTQLLDDIRDFSRRPNPQPEDFYCLQPLVIKALADGKLEVVDGQQRLTTILLLLRHFNDRQVERFRQPTYTLEYETRPGLGVFLSHPSQDAATENADFHHFYEAITSLEEWFAEHDADVEEIKLTLLNKTKVIWFQLAETDNSVDAFTRLNVGKIPLTNDELIRALFLRRSATRDAEITDEQLHVAYQWDLIEKSLQADAFWYFLSNEPSKTANRIGFLFNLVAQAQGIVADHAGDTYGIFHHFNARLSQSGIRADLAWREIKQLHLTIEEWFEDRTLFHMIGFLVSEGMGINDLRALAEGTSKSLFQARLRKEIFLTTMRVELKEGADASVIRELVDDRLEKISYPASSRDIRRVLLLFNVATLLMDTRSNVRFQFDAFKSEAWDIEHVRSVAEDKPERHDERRDWLRHCLAFLSVEVANAGLCKGIETFLGLNRTDATNELFDPLYEEILACFGEAVDGSDKHRISNLTLLDEGTNRSYKNAVFAIKRQSILSLDQAGIFVPLCTRNVFLKCYSPNVGHAMLWTDEDREGYRLSLSDTLVRFFAGPTEVAA